MYFFLWQPLLSCFNCFTWEIYFPGLISKTVVWSFQASIADGRRIEGKSLVMPFYTSSCCLWEVSIAVIHGTIRSTPIENCFSIVVRFLISQLWSKFVNIAGVSRNFTFWRSRRSWYCLIKYPAFASVKTVTQPPKSFVHSKLLCFPSCFEKIRCWYYQRRAYGINILSVHSCKYRTRTRTHGTKATLRP